MSTLGTELEAIAISWLLAGGILGIGAALMWLALWIEGRTR